MIDEIKRRHHGLARDLAGGYKVEHCATKWGFKLETAIYLSTHHLFKELIKQYKENDGKNSQGNNN